MTYTQTDDSESIRSRRSSISADLSRAKSWKASRTEYAATGGHPDSEDDLSGFFHNSPFRQSFGPRTGRPASLSSTGSSAVSYTSTPELGTASRFWLPSVSGTADTSNIKSSWRPTAVDANHLARQEGYMVDSEVSSVASTAYSKYDAGLDRSCEGSQSGNERTGVASTAPSLSSMTSRSS